jgi:lysine-specific demethylase 8
MAEVERIAATDAAAWQRAEREGRPVVIAGGARSHHAWTPEFLAGLVGDVAIRYKQSRSHQHPDFHAATLAEMFATGAGTVRELLAAIASGPERARRLFTGDEQFLVQVRDGVTTTNRELAPLYADVEMPPQVPRERLYTVWAWFSGAGVRTWLHYDNNGCHNLNAQLAGTKRCWLFEPDRLAELAPFPLGGTNPAHNCSRLDVEAGDFAVPHVDATLYAGDLLFIPAWWSHTFEHLGEFNANVNFWWKPEHPLANATAALQRVLELAAATGIDARADDPAAALLRRLDELAIARA